MKNKTKIKKGGKGERGGGGGGGEGRGRGERERGERGGEGRGGERGRGNIRCVRGDGFNVYHLFHELLHWSTPHLRIQKRYVPCNEVNEGHL